MTLTTPAAAAGDAGDEAAAAAAAAVVVDSTTPAAAASATSTTDAPVADKAASVAEAAEQPDSSASQDSEEDASAYRARFLVAGSVFFLNMANGLLWSTYVAVTPTTAVFYNTTQWNINVVSVVFTAMFSLFIFPAVWLLDNKGLRPTILVGALGNIVGSAVRVLSWVMPDNGKMPVLILGQLIAGISQPYLLNVPTKSSAVWFTDKERLTANTVMNLGQPLGIALMSLLAPVIVTEDNPSAVNTLNLVTFILTLAMSTPAAFAQSKPPTPPSKSADVPSTPFWEGARIVFRNKWFILLATSFAFLLTSFNVFTTFASSYIDPYGYSSSDSGNILVILIVIGIIAAAIIGIVLDRTKQHRMAMKILAVGIAVGVILYTAFASPGNIGELYGAAAIIGISGMPLLPLCLEMGVECTHPVAEGTSSGIMWGLTQFLTVVMTLVSNALTDPDGDMKKAMYLLVAMVILPMVLLQFYNVSNRRIMFETSQDVSPRADEAVSLDKPGKEQVETLIVTKGAEDNV
ncbi:major facilitator superfamily domain-containing protein [Zopfochytrium polystomum]|nr:major facilitator superfamily domain-containing protein [Zopfochytrium polystomum]